MAPMPPPVTCYAWATGVWPISPDHRIWSPVKIVFPTGRLQPELLLLPNGDLLMTVIRRIDIRDTGKEAGQGQQ